MTIVAGPLFAQAKATITGVPEIPFSAVRGFYDPSVSFELEFDVNQEAAEAPVATLPTAEAAKPQPVPAEAKPAKGAADAPKKQAKKPQADDGKSADVVSLDAFRKK